MSETITDAPIVAIVDYGQTGISEQELELCAEALFFQVNQEIAMAPPEGYGVYVGDVIVVKPEQVKPEHWVLALDRDTDSGLGYHDKTEHGMPKMCVFPFADKEDNVPWTVTASHELLETLINPEVNRAAQSPDGAFWAYEICDAVEADYYAIGNVVVSNWCRSTWFEPPPRMSGVSYDYMNLCTKPFEIRPGGYGQYWNGESPAWKEIFYPDKQPRQYRLAHHGRRSRRRERFARRGAL